MLKKSTLREIRSSLARYLAIFAIVALGVGFFSGLKDCKASMVKTATAYLNEHNLYDYQLLSSYGIDDESVDIALAEDGVSGAEGSIQIDVMASSGNEGEAALRAISLPDKINTLRLVRGRLPDAGDECVIDDYHITGEGYRIGDTIYFTDANDKDKLKQFKHREYKIVGTVNTPIYLDYQRGSTDIGDGSLETFFFIDKSEFDMDYYTQLYLTLEGDEQPFTDEKKDSLEAAEDGMEDLAERITAARRETAMKDAREELDEKKQEYEDNLAKYEKEKADAESKIRKAKNQLNSGQKKIDSERKKVKSLKKQAEGGIDELNKKLTEVEAGITTADDTIAGLNEKKNAVKAGLTEAEKGRKKLTEARSQLEAAAKADPENAEAYAAKIAALDKQIADVDSRIKEANKGLKEINSGLVKAKKARKKAVEGKNTIKDKLAEAEEGLNQAKDGIIKLDTEEKKIKDGRQTLRKQEREADAEFEKAKKKLDDAAEKLDEAQEKIDDMETGNSYAFSRDENAGYSSFDSNSSIVSNIAKVFPVFFFLIAALVCMTTMTRMVDEQRTQIGVLKALGYSNAQIAGKYLFYSGSAAFLGAVIGFFIGCKVFPAVIWNAYTMMYDFSEEVEFVFDAKLGLFSLAAALLCSMGATWASIARDFRVSPSELIRPKTPPAGKRILLERIGPLWRRISFLYKVSIRNIFRDKKRFLMMVVGVSGCTALLIAGTGIRTTIADVADHQFNEVSLYDFVTVFSKNMNAGRKADFIDYMDENAGVSADEIFFEHQAEVTILTDEGNVDLTCTAAPPENFGNYVSLHEAGEPLEFPGEGEVVLVKKISHDYNINTGDEITIRDGYREATFKVSGICDNYVYDTVYMSIDTYEKGFGKKPDIKTALVRLNRDGAETADSVEESGDAAEMTDEDIRAAATEAANYEHTAAVSVTLDVRENVGKMMKSLDMVIYVVILSAALLAFIVLYNLTNINITERIREIATIKVLGFNQFEVSQYVFRENIFLTAIAAAVGIPLGKWLLRFVIDNIVVKMIFFEPRLTKMDIVLSVVLTFVFAVFVNIAMQRRLRNVSMTESLKSVE